MLIEWKDLLVVFFVLGLSFGLFYLVVFPKVSSKFLRFQLIGLWVYHFVLTIFFHDYLINHGGDAIRYWGVSADLSQYAQSWFGYFGFSTFFIQWLNYIPSKVLGLSFLSGNLLYGLFSFLGILLGVLGTRRLFEEEKIKSIVASIPYLIWWFPGLHFWIAGVGKEAILFVGLTGIWYYSFPGSKMPFYPVGFWLLIFFIKPLIGLVLFPVLIIRFGRGVELKRGWGLAMILGLMPLLYFGIQWLWAYSHLESLAFSELLRFSRDQLRFLSSFKADSEVPMQEYGVIWRGITVLFRPFIWEAWDVFSLIMAIENLFLLVLFIFAILLGGKSLVSCPKHVMFFMLVSLFMIFIYSMTLNNYGLFYRMKSVWLPFLYISFLWLIWPFIIRKTR